jgi:pyruvate dehydrogenase E2 component (dihydrolipoamide acetyltransferase)
MPKLGNTVESVILVAWKKQVGDAVALDDVLCEVETDKATMEVPSTTAGTVLALLAKEGAEVAVMTPIAVIGAAGEAAGEVAGEAGAAPAASAAAPPSTAAATPAPAVSVATAPTPAAGQPGAPVSPRARHLAEHKGVDAGSLPGSGPGGRVIERDVLAALATQPKLTPVARAMVAEGGFAVPAQGSGPGGRVTAKDLIRGEEAAPAPAAVPVGVPAAVPVVPAAVPAQPAPPAEVEVEVIPVRGVRKVIAERMLQSLQTTAQLTLHASADARALQAYRQRLKGSPPELGLQGVTLNDFILFAVARTLPRFPALNALFVGDEMRQHRRVHLGVAVDTPRGLLVPVVHQADTLSLRQLAAEAKRLATACQENKITPDELAGGTFTVTNLGHLGVEAFTPVLNAPQVGILGVGSINLKPVQGAAGVEFVPHIGLSLTINHQVVDGAPAARFLQALSQALATFDLLLAG